MNQAVTELIVRGRTEGVVEARREVEALEAAHEKVQATTERATLGLERMSARVQSRLDPQFRATQQLARAEADLNLLQSKGLIDQERRNVLLAQATALYGTTGAAARGAAAGIATTGQAAQLSAFQVQNLSFQMNDIAMGLATGQSPFRVMAQQGSQIVQIFGSGTGVVAALKATGTAMTSFLLNPLTLTALGFGLALEAGLRFFSGVTGGSDEIEDRLERQADLVKRIGEHFKEAAGAARELPATLSFLADREIERLQNTLRGQVQDLFAQGAVAQAVGQAPGLGGEFGIDNPSLDPDIANRFRELATAVQVFQRELAGGRDPATLLLDFNEQIARLAEASADPAVKAMAEDILRLTGGFDNAEDGATGLALGIRELIDAATRGAGALASLKRELEAYGKALEQLEGVGRERLSPRQLAGEQLRLAADAAQGLDDVTVALDAYGAALDRVAAAEEKSDLAALADARFQAAAAGLSDYARGVAEINREIDQLISKRLAEGGDPALLEQRRGVRLDAFDASRQAEFNQLIAERRQSLAEEAGALGLSETALAKYRAELELTNAAMRLFGAVSPEMAAQIRELGDAAAAAVAAQARMREQIAAMDQLRGDVRGFLGDFVSGLRQGESAADALTAALNRLLDRLLNMGLDMIVGSLFGQQGTAGGGLLGGGGGGLLSGLFGGLFGGGGGGGRASGPVPVTIAAVAPNLGAAGGASGGYIAANGLDMAAGGLRISPLGGGVPFAGTINAAAQQYGLSPSLLMGIIRQESNFNPTAVSPAGAQGLMQLMPGTAAGLGVTNAFDPTQNIFGGAQYLRQQLDRFGSVETGLAAYNAGPGRVAAAGGDLSRLPLETQNYVPAVLAHQQAFVDGAGGMADATTQAADTLSSGLQPAADQMASAAQQAATGAEQLGAGVTGAGQTAQDAAGQFSGAFPGALQQVIQSIASAGGGSPFGGFGGGNFFGAFLGGGGFGGAPGFTPGVVMSHHRGGIVGEPANGNSRLASPEWFRDAVRAHGGMRLAPDERPIIAQTGERVLNRTETAAYEAGGARGAGGGRTTVTIRTGDTILNVASDVPQKTRDELRAMLEDNNARQKQELKATFGEYQNSYATLKAG